MQFKEFCSLCNTADLFDNDFTLEEVKFVYTSSKLTSIDEMSGADHKLLTFVDFIECLARMCGFKSLRDLNLLPEEDDRPLAVKIPILLGQIMDQMRANSADLRQKLKIKRVPIQKSNLLKEGAKGPALNSRDKKLESRRLLVNKEGKKVMSALILRKKQEKHAIRLQAIFRGAAPRKEFAARMAIVASVNRQYKEPETVEVEVKKPPVEKSGGGVSKYSRRTGIDTKLRK
jgi:hypothetical protein